MSESEDSDEFIEKYSSSSCYLSQIDNFLFGPQSSRFWMLRKHINSTPIFGQKSIPFNSWNCLTLQMVHRDVDLVIKNEKHMKMIIQCLVHNMKTLDGQRGSAAKILEELRKQNVKDYKRDHKRTEISKSREK